MTAISAQCQSSLATGFRPQIQWPSRTGLGDWTGLAEVAEYAQLLPVSGQSRTGLGHWIQREKRPVQPSPPSTRGTGRDAGIV